MTDQTVGVVDQSGTGTKKVDTSELTVGSNTVERQRMVIADPVGAGLLANVTAGGALTTDASATTQPVSGTFWQTTQPVSGTVTSTGTLSANQGGTWTVQPGNTANTTAWKVDGSAVTQPVSGTFWQTTQPVSGTVAATISGNWAVVSTGLGTTNAATNYHHLVSAATTNATSVKVTAGRVYNGALCNTSASAKYFKFYNKASAPTVGTDTPVFTLMVPAGATIGLASVITNIGLFFATGVAYAITGAAADSDTTAVAAGDMIVNLNYV